VKYAEAVKTCRKIYNFNGTSHSTLMVARNENDTAFLNKYAGKLYSHLYGNFECFEK
jgi:hypothetical protein